MIKFKDLKLGDSVYVFHKDCAYIDKVLNITDEYIEVEGLTFPFSKHKCLKWEDGSFIACNSYIAQATLDKLIKQRIRKLLNLRWE